MSKGRRFKQEPGVSAGIDTLRREAALLREYIALLERTNCTLTGFAHAHGMISAPRDVAEGKRLRAAIAELRGEGDEQSAD